MPEYIAQAYEKFLAFFPAMIRPLVSVGLAVLLVYSVWGFLKKNFIALVVLIVLLPASVPILKAAAGYLVTLVKFVLNI
ncbi:MAG TPA: hypothetical protein VEA59_00500 [Patescibacteria group bacterium]|nr:hypothetical protein [Patescibacteria group bacterium]